MSSTRWTCYCADQVLDRSAAPTSQAACASHSRHMLTLTLPTQHHVQKFLDFPCELLLGTVASSSMCDAHCPGLLIHHPSHQALATAVDTFGAVLETHRWVPSSALAARSRRTTDDRSADGTAAGDHRLLQF